MAPPATRFGGKHRGLHVQALAEVDGIFFAGAGNDSFGGVELVEGGEGRLVGEVVLAGFHHAATDGTAIAGHGGGGDEVHGAVGQDFVERAGDLGLRIFGEEGFDFFASGS